MYRGRLFLWIVFLIFIPQIIFAKDTDDLKSEIYPKLRDKRCTEMTLDKCDCPDAREMKAYIEALIDTGVSKDEIFYKVAKKFSLNTIVDEKIKQNVEKRLIAEAGEKRPQIVLEPATFNFGKVSKKQGKISKNFKVYNKGNQDLAITNIRVSCNCTTVSLKVGRNKSPEFAIAGSPAGWREIIPPGKSGELAVALDLAHASMTIGKHARDIFIASNDPLYPQITLKVEIEVRE